MSFTACRNVWKKKYVILWITYPVTQSFLAIVLSEDELDDYLKTLLDR
jgi:hypothetical protein